MCELWPGDPSHHSKAKGTLSRQTQGQSIMAVGCLFFLQPQPYTSTMENLTCKI